MQAYAQTVLDVVLHVWKQLFDMFGVSCGPFWMKVQGYQAETIPNIPIYPRSVDLCKKTLTMFRICVCENIEHVFYCFIVFTSACFMASSQARRTAAFQVRRTTATIHT